MRPLWIALFGLVIGCGGGSSPPSDASTPPDLSSPFGNHNVQPVVCAGATCSATLQPVCCSNDKGATGTCGATLGDDCGESGTPWTDCTSDSGCATGSHCCGHVHLTTLAFRCQSDTCSGGDVNGCQLPADCPLGQMCCKYNASGPSFGHCATSCP